MKMTLAKSLTLTTILLSTAACGSSVSANPTSFQSAGLNAPYYGVGHRPVAPRSGSARAHESHADDEVQSRAPSSQRDSRIASAQRPAERESPTRPPIPSVQDGQQQPMRAGGGYDPQLAVSYIVDTYEMNGVEFDNPAAMRIVDLYRSVQREGTIYHTTQPVVGDLVFFHNTYDANRDSRNNDWYTHVGVIESVGSDGTITFLSYRQGEVVRDVMNLREPREERIDGQAANSALRERGSDDAAWTQYRSGELFAGFGSLLGSRSDVVVIDRWDPSRSASLSAGR